ncbi:MAG: BamA/TamA family outer membrane protein [Planctomycetes bacterium]|nr:BamA/TamA family outer membrane protein [Planctomycetota bacterium]
MSLKATAVLLLTWAAAAQEVVFEGVVAGDEAEIREVIRPDMERYERNPRQTILDDAAFRIANHYRTLGYYFVQVQAHPQDGRIFFAVQEGPPVTLGRVHIVGNDVFKDEELLAAAPDVPGLGTAFSRRLAAVYRRAILEAYHNRGHIEATVSEPKLSYDAANRKMNMTFVITEGPAYLVGHIEGAPEDLAAGFLGRRYGPDTPAVFEAVVLDRWRDTGHPFARVRVRPRIDAPNARVTLEVESDPGPRVRIAGVRLRGLSQARASFVENRVDLNVGSLYEASELRAAADRLRATGLFRGVSVTPGDLVQEGVMVNIDVEEREPGEIAIRGGYGTLEGPRIGGEIAYLNVFGGAETVRLGGTFSRQNSRGTLEAGVPYVFGSDLRLGAGFHYEETSFPSFDAVSYGGLPSLTIPLDDRVQLTTGVRLAFVRTLEVEAAIAPEDELDFDYRALSLAVTIDRRDNEVIPRRGYRLDALVEWSGGIFDSDIEFARTSGSGSLAVPLPWDLTLAMSLHGGLIVPVGDTDVIPIALRYFAGGTNTVRGFEFGTLGPKVGDEPTGGEVFLALQSEARFPIYGVLHGAVFADRGGVWLEHTEVDLGEARYAIGVGLRVYTVAAAIVGDVGWNVRREEDEDRVEVHLSIGFPF